MRSNEDVKLTLIRHAQSRFNVHEFDPAYGGKEGSWYHPDLIDPLITDKGLAQAKSAQEKIGAKPYDFIFVSPLRRALQTATVIFEKNEGCPKFIAVPMLSERFHCAGDLGSDLDTVKRNFKHVDFAVVDGLVNPDYWYLENLADEKWREVMLKEIKEQGIEDKDKAAAHILSLMKIRGEDPESYTDFTARVGKAIEFIKEFIAKEGLEKKYAVVAHGYFLREFTTIVSKDRSWFDNCEIKEVSLRV